MTRPLAMLSSTATSSATRTGRWSGSRSIAVPIFILLVRAAIADAASSTDGHSPSSLKMVLDEPRGVEAQVLRKLDLLEHLAVNLRMRLARAVRRLQIEGADTEFHQCDLLPVVCKAGCAINCRK